MVPTTSRILCLISPPGTIPVVSAANNNNNCERRLFYAPWYYYHIYLKLRLPPIFWVHIMGLSFSFLTLIVFYLFLLYNLFSIFLPTDIFLSFSFFSVYQLLFTFSFPWPVFRSCLYLDQQSTAFATNCERRLFYAPWYYYHIYLKLRLPPIFWVCITGLPFSLSKLFYVDSLCWCK